MALEFQLINSSVSSERFHRVTSRESKRIKGTGLGLFIVRSIVKRHKGRVFAESPGVGMGSTFIVELPRV